MIAAFYHKKCFGKNKCWNNIRVKCPISVECRLKAHADKVKIAVCKDKVKK